MSPTHTRTHSTDTEMHELNQEADYLEEKMHIVPAGINGTDAKLQRHSSDPDAQAQVIQSLRSQIQDLFSQVSQLNNKLVNSYDRMSDLEDELHVTTSSLRTSTLKISELELERSQHLSALSTGLLVEKDHVTSELNRLMEKATEEAAQRGQAETAREQIEKDLDDLSASLFNQANSMVAEARIGKARSERKAEETEQALKQAEEVVGLLQEQMQALQAEKERADRRVEDMRITMGKGKWVDREHEPLQTARPRLLCSHIPYQEYLSFVSHLRSIRPATQHPPAMSTLLPLPFLARLVTEDSDPTVRLDLAPSLNWLTRRSVISAIHSGQLTVEPMPTATLLEELAPSTIPGNSYHTHISCALCGTAIFSSSGPDSPTSTTFTSSATSARPNINNSWSTSLFKSSLVQSISAANPGVLAQPYGQSPVLSEPPAQVYIFRLEATSGGLPVLSSQQNSGQHRPTIYPLCTTKWCLARLRTTCSMWAFIRTGMVEKIWEESIYVPPSHHSPKTSVDKLDGAADADRKPLVPPRRTRMGIGALWGSVQRSLSSGREIEGSPSPHKEAEAEKPLPKSPTKKFSLPPPVHPSISAPPAVRPSSVPPPLPKRNRGREMKAATLSAPERVDEEGVVPTPPLSRLNSQDQFDTPAEEIPSFIPARTSSPASIPLPPSSPPSPEPQSQPEEAQEPPAAETPSPDTPVASTPTLTSSHVHSEADSLRGPSPAPPPLPRRAATRPRPVSIFVPPSADPAPAERTAPAPAEIEKDASVIAESEENRVTEEISVNPPIEEIQEEADAPTDTVSSFEDEQFTVESKVEATSTLEEPVSSEKDGEEVSSPAEETVQPSEERPADHHAETTVDIADAEKSMDAIVVEAPSSETIVEAAADQSSEEPSSPVAPSTNGVVDGIEAQLHKDYAGPTKAAPVLEKSEPPPEYTESQTEVDSSLCVGDATWEERTWRELVRLREEMFWARIGGVR